MRKVSYNVALRTYLIKLTNGFTQAFYRETLLWKGLTHDHVLPFLGVTEDVFPRTICMVTPWMKNGNIMEYIDVQLKDACLEGDKLLTATITWVSVVVEPHIPHLSTDQMCFSSTKSLLA